MGEYESNDYKDISSHSLEVLSKFYGVSVDYLLRITENDIEANTPIEELHLTDEAIAVLKSGKINTRLLSEMISHPAFRKMMTDSEIYVDRIATSRLHDTNMMLEAIRQQMITEKGADPDDIYMQTLKVAQFSEDDFFGSTINKDIMEILSSIRDAHVNDSTTADTTATSLAMNALDELKQFEGSAEVAKVAMLLRQLGIKYSKITKAELVTLINVFRKSDLLKSPLSKRGKGKSKKR